MESPNGTTLRILVSQNSANSSIKEPSFSCATVRYLDATPIYSLPQALVLLRHDSSFFPESHLEIHPVAFYDFIPIRRKPGMAFHILAAAKRDSRPSRRSFFPIIGSRASSTSFAFSPESQPEINPVAVNDSMLADREPGMAFHFVTTAEGGSGSSLKSDAGSSSP